MRKKRNGFTLVELLITVAIMLTILIISIVSLTNVSSKKKERAYENVVSEIETAGETYLSNNEYLFEGLAEGAFGSISLGKLVNEDYLNVATNPKTGKKFSYCSRVEVTKVSNNAYNVKFNDINDNSKNCDTDDSIEIKEAGAPDIEFKMSGNKYGDWYNDNNTEATLTIKKYGSESIKSVVIKIDEEEVTYTQKDDIYTVKIGNQTISSNVKVLVTNSSDKSVTKSISYKRDTIAPNCTITKTSGTQGKNSWYTTAPTFSAKCSDAISGCTSNEAISKKFSTSSEVNENLIATVTDNAGHETKCTETFGVDVSTPTITMNGYKKTESKTVSSNSGLSTYTFGNWYNKYVYVQASYNAGFSGVKSFVCKSKYENNENVFGTFKDENGTFKYKYKNVGDEGNTTVTCTLETNSGITKSLSKTVNLDQTEPTCSDVELSTEINGKGNYDNDLQWYKKNVKYSAKCSDAISGCKTTDLSKTFSDEGIYNKYYLTAEDNAGNKTKCSNKTFGIDKTKPTIKRDVSKADTCDGYTGARTQYTVEDTISGIARVQDYYSTYKYDDNSDEAKNNFKNGTGRYRVQEKTVTTNGVPGHWTNKESKSIRGDLSKITYDDIWTKNGTCKGSKPISNGTWYHYEKACDVAGNCTYKRTPGEKAITIK